MTDSNETAFFDRIDRLTTANHELQEYAGARGEDEAERGEAPGRWVPRTAEIGASQVRRTR
jgi:hypothetical protein